MKITHSLLLSLASLTTTLTAQAGVTDETYRTTAYFFGVAQGTNTVTERPKYETFYFAGHNLVNLAMGRKLTGTVDTNQVLAMTFACDLSSASLVVYDKQASNVVANIASSVSVDTVQQQDANAKGPNHAHFVATLQVNNVGDATNGLVGGYFTVAGRLNLNPTNGCPQPVAVGLDQDFLDRVDDNIEIPASLDADSTPLTQRTGLAHLIGVVDAVTAGSTNTVLVPYGALSVHRILPSAPAPVVTSPISN